MIKLSIVFPCYNQTHLLEEAFSFLEKSKEKNFIKIIKHDCSTANYRAFLNNEIWRPLEYIENKTNLGAIKNMISCLFIKSEGKYIMCHHEDDLIHESYLKIAIDYLDSNPEVSFIGSEFVLFNKKEDITQKKYEQVTINKYNLKEISNFFSENDTLAFGSVIYRRKDISENQINTNDYAMMFDRPFLLKILEQKGGVGAIIKSPLYFYRYHKYPDNRWKGLKIENIFNLFLLYKQVDPNNRIFRRYFFDFAGLDGKKLKNFKYFIYSLKHLKLKYTLPNQKSVKFIFAGIIIILLGKKNYSKLFEIIKNKINL